MAERFGRFLLRREVITELQLLTALQLQEASRPNVLVLGTELGFFTVARALELHEAMEESERSFSEEVIHRRTLSPESLARLMRLRNDRTPRLGEVLLHEGILDAGVLLRELVHHSVTAGKPPPAMGFAATHLSIHATSAATPLLPRSATRPSTHRGR